MPCPCTVLSVTDDGPEVAIFYRYEKPGGPLVVAQWFRITDGRIAETQLVFDGRGVEGGPS